MFRRFARMLCCFLLWIGGSDALMGATRTVVNVSDTGAGSLRQALGEAQPGDTITFNLGTTPQTIALASPLSLAKNVTITGPGADLLTLDGGSGWSTHPAIWPVSGHRILDISASTVTISGLRFQNGYVAGAGMAGAATGENGAAIRILSPSSVTVEACWFSFNHAKDRWDDPPVGGAIHLDQGTLVVRNSSFHDNYAGAGSAISNYAGIVNLANCTLSGNVAYAGGAFIHVPAGKVSTLEHCTVVENTSLNTVDSGGISVINGSVVLKESLVAANSFGWDHIPQVNYVDLDPNWAGSGTIGSQGGNVLGNPGDVPFAAATQDKVGTWTAPLDPQILPLNTARELGGNTPYHPLATGSPAINNGIETGGSDQRGVAWVGKGDSGSLEYVPLTISGQVGIGGATLAYSDGGEKTVTADGSGHYALPVGPLWSGTVTPSHPGYVFEPTTRSYSSLTVNRSGENYTAHLLVAPSITSAAAVTFQAGSGNTFTVTTTGYPSGAGMVLQSSGSLPSGVTFKDNQNCTATLSGAPALGSNPTYTLTLTASNGVDPVANQAFTLTVHQAPTFTSSNATTFMIGTEGTFTIVAAGSPTGAAMTYGLTGTLPEGVTFTDHRNGTASLAGTPESGTGGAYSLALSASNGVGSAATQAFTLTVNQAPVFTSANAIAFTELEAATFTIVTSAFPMVTSLTCTGILPSGLTFTERGDGTATLSGTPLSGSAGTYALTFKATNSVVPDGTQAFTVTIHRAPPVIATGAATSVTATAAVLKGLVDARGTSTNTRFRWGTSAGIYPSIATATPSPVTGMGAVSVSATLSGLLPNTTYHFVAEGENDGTWIPGEAMSFTTSMLAPAVTTGTAINVTSEGATLRGVVNAQNASTTVAFEWGLNPAALTQTYSLSGALGGTDDTQVACSLTGLGPRITYHYRVVATNGGGATPGEIQSFTTPYASLVRVQGATPTLGSVGTVVTVTGSGFTNASSVVIGGMEAMFIVVSDTELACIVPPGAVTGPIRVTSPAGTGTSSLVFTVKQEG